MANKIKKTLSMVLVMCMLVSVLPMQALAADDEAPFTPTDTMTGGDLVITITPSESNNNQSSVSVSGTNGSGAEVQLGGSSTTTENSVTGSNGTVTNTTTTEVKLNGTETDGSIVKDVTYNDKTVDTTIIESNGTVTEQTVTSGSERKEYTGDSPIDLPPVQGMPSIEFKEGETDKRFTEDLETPATSTTGDKPTDENDKTYHYTKVTVDSTDRTVTGSLTVEEDFVIDPSKSDLNCPVQSDEYEGKETADEVNSKDFTDHYWGGLDHGAKDMLNPNAKPEKDGFDKGYDMVWTGIGDNSSAVSAIVVVEAVYLKDENGNDLLDENGEKMLDWVNSKFATGEKSFALDENGNEIYEPERDENGNIVYDADGNVVYAKNSKGELIRKGAGMLLAPAQFILQHENENYFYAYCMDASTNAQPTQNRWYNIQNLESVVGESEDDYENYLTKEQAAMIRAIANAGYWGCDPNVLEQAKDENGDPVFETNENGEEVPVMVPQAGSIESLKNLLKGLYEGKEGEENSITVNYPGVGGITCEDFSKLIDGLTESEALAATQAAIWHFANMGDTDIAKKNVANGTVVGLLSGAKWHNGEDDKAKGWLTEFRAAYLTDESYFGEGEYNKQAFFESDARMQALYKALLGLTPIYEDGATKTDTNVIPNEDVINDVTMVIKDKVADHISNSDENKDNDVYHGEVSFTLAFVPDKNSDDLIVCLVKDYNEDGTPNYLTDANGDPIIRRLAGENSEGASYDAIEAVDGVYTLKGLQLSENSEHTFDIRLEGTQYLEKGVYIYQALNANGEESRGASQTLVGMAQGNQHVTVTNQISFTFDVDEQNHVIVEEFWSNEYDPVIYPPNPPMLIDEPPVYRMTNDQLEEIPDEEVPLAAPVVTGDNSIVWVIAIAMAMLMLLAINLPMAKRPRGKHEAI